MLPRRRFCSLTASHGAHDAAPRAVRRVGDGGVVAGDAAPATRRAPATGPQAGDAAPARRPQRRRRGVDAGLHGRAEDLGAGHHRVARRVAARHARPGGHHRAPPQSARALRHPQLAERAHVRPRPGRRRRRGRGARRGADRRRRRRRAARRPRGRRRRAAPRDAPRGRAAARDLRAGVVGLRVRARVRVAGARRPGGARRHAQQGLRAPRSPEGRRAPGRQGRRGRGGGREARRAQDTHGPLQRGHPRRPPAGRPRDADEFAGLLREGRRVALRRQHARALPPHRPQVRNHRRGAGAVPGAAPRAPRLRRARRRGVPPRVFDGGVAGDAPRVRAELPGGGQRPVAIFERFCVGKQ